MSKAVEENERDAVFARLLAQPENKQCFDCGSSNPKWASVNNGVFVCFQCSGRHRQMGVHISFMKSCGYDKWNSKQLKQMELGGNKAAKAFFLKHDLYVEGHANYSNPQAAKYRADLLKKAEAALSDLEGFSEIKKVEEVKVEEEKEQVIEQFEKPPVKQAVITTTSFPKKEAQGIQFHSIKKANQQQSLKGKKIDIDFDALEEEPEEAPEEPEEKFIPVTKKSSPPAIKKMQGISSTDYNRLSGADAEETHEKLVKFANHKAISSDDYYGISRPKPPKEEGGIMKAGIAVFESAKDKAMSLTEMAAGWVKSFRKGSEDDSY